MSYRNGKMDLVSVRTMLAGLIRDSAAQSVSFLPSVGAEGGGATSAVLGTSAGCWESLSARPGGLNCIVTVCIAVSWLLPMSTARQRSLAAQVQGLPRSPAKVMSPGGMGHLDTSPLSTSRFRMRAGRTSLS
jgi:hypothetical protein